MLNKWQKVSSNEDCSLARTVGPIWCVKGPCSGVIQRSFPQPESRARTLCAVMLVWADDNSGWNLPLRVVLMGGNNLESRITFIIGHFSQSVCPSKSHSFILIIFIIHTLWICVIIYFSIKWNVFVFCLIISILIIVPVIEFDFSLYNVYD